MIQVAVHKKSQQVLIEAGRQIMLHRQGIEQAFFEIGQESVREVRTLIRSGERTGRIYRFRGRPHRASAPGEVPASRSGRLLRSSDYKVSGWYQMRFGETVEYAKFLEEGTRNMAPRPHLLVAVNNQARSTQKALLEYGLQAIGYK